MHRIVNESPRTIKSLALQTLRGKWADGILVMVISYVLTNVPVNIMYAISQGRLMGMLSSIYSCLIAGPLNMAVAYYMLRLFRQQDPDYRDMLIGADYKQNAILLYMLIYFRTLFGFFLFIVPGILTMIKYSQAFYILADDPLKSPQQCMYESEYLMQGNKAAFFNLQISFIGWYFLSSIPQSTWSYTLTGGASAASGDLNSMLSAYAAMNSNLGYELLGLLSLIVDLYREVANACFYDMLVGNLVLRTEDEYYGGYGGYNGYSGYGSTQNPFTGEDTEYKDTDSRDL